MTESSSEQVPETEVTPAAEGEAAVASLDIGSQAGAAPTGVPQNIRGRIDKDGTAIGTGRRKTSVARVRLKKGTGKFTVNDREMEEFFCIERDRLMIIAPLKLTSTLGQFDIWVRVNGGGTTGQAGAIILGIARALQAINPEHHKVLSENSFLTRDDRMVERKKYGHKKARRSFQFSKR